MIWWLRTAPDMTDETPQRDAPDFQTGAFRILQFTLACGYRLI